MAETEKKTTTRKKTTTKKDDALKLLERQNKELQEQMKALMAQLSQAKSINNSADNSADLNKKYKCYNLTHAILTVASGRNGGVLQKEKIFKKYGEYKMLKLAEIEDIYNTMPRVIESCWLYIDDKKVYDYLGLEFENIVTKNKMDELIKLETYEDIDIIANLDSELKRQVINEIVERMIAKESYDYNKLMQLKDKTKIDIFELKKDRENIKAE